MFTSSSEVCMPLPCICSSTMSMMLCRTQTPPSQLPGRGQVQPVMQSLTAVSVFALLVSVAAGVQLDVVDSLRSLERQRPAPDSLERDMPEPETLETHRPEEDSPGVDAPDPIDAKYAHYMPPYVVFLFVLCAQRLRVFRLPGFVPMQHRVRSQQSPW